MFEYPATRYTADVPGRIGLDAGSFEYIRETLAPPALGALDGTITGKEIVVHNATEEMEKPRLDGDPAVADRVENIVADIATGRATPMHRARIKGAIEKVEAPLTGRARADAGLGRAIRFGGV